MLLDAGVGDAASPAAVPLDAMSVAAPPAVPLDAMSGAAPPAPADSNVSPVPADAAH